MLRLSSGNLNTRTQNSVGIHSQRETPSLTSFAYRCEEKNNNKLELVSDMRSSFGTKAFNTSINLCMVFI